MAAGNASHIVRQGERHAAFGLSPARLVPKPTAWGRAEAEEVDENEPVAPGQRLDAAAPIPHRAGHARKKRHDGTAAPIWRE
jgi:hypothetical protein